MPVSKYKSHNKLNVRPKLVPQRRNLKQVNEEDREPTDREQIFIDHYLATLNGGKAALAAGYSPKSAHQNACVLRRKPHIKKRIEDALARRSAELRVDATWVLKEAVAMFRELREANKLDVSAIMNPDGSLKPVELWPPKWREKQMLRSMEVVETFETLGRKRIFTGYIKKIGSTDHKVLEATLLRIIGDHVNIRAFDPARENEGRGNPALKNPEIVLKVVYEPGPKPQVVKSNGDASGHNDGPSGPNSTRTN